MLNMFNAMAVLNRVPTPHHLYGIPAKLPTKEEDINLDNYLPNDDDMKQLSEDIKFLISRDLVRYVKVFSWADAHVDKLIKHSYMEYTTTKSCIVSPGFVTFLVKKFTGHLYSSSSKLQILFQFFK